MKPRKRKGARGPSGSSSQGNSSNQESRKPPNQRILQLSLFANFLLVVLVLFLVKVSRFAGPGPMVSTVSAVINNGRGHGEKQLAKVYLERAATFDARKGEGYDGWLHLLAAFDFDHENDHILRNLIQNYRSTRLTYLALDELENLLKENPNREMALHLKEMIAKEDPEEFESYQNRKIQANAVRSKLNVQSEKLGNATFTVPFATTFVKFDLVHQNPEYKVLNQEFYEATMEAYQIVKKEWKGISDTELNHKFFQWQMKILRETGDYWKGYTDLKLFRDLMETMRLGAAKMLIAHGFDHETATRKAQHEVIFWASVHTENSIHEPHMTEDSLIGGVYYSSVPPNSGVLDLFDPRQKLKNGLASPPFHRTYTIQPKEGMLVLFPGWLVHTVRQSSGLNVAKDGYRISISVNLKGEWQSTTKLVLKNVRLDHGA